MLFCIRLEDMDIAARGKSKSSPAGVVGNKVGDAKFSPGKKAQQIL